MFKHLENIEQRYKQLQELLAKPETLADKKLYARSAKELAQLSANVDKYRAYKALCQEIGKVEALCRSGQDQKEKEFLELAQQELQQLNKQKEDLAAGLEDCLLDKEGAAHKNIIVEIRAGTGGEEAALFVADLYRMYTKFAQSQVWKVELMSSRPTEIGGFKETVFSLQGEDVFKKLRFESGVHRVQRVPATEAQGRIHTSAVSVAVLPEPKELDVKIDAKDIRIDVFRSTGPGGQSVNTTDSAVRITHLSSGIVVTCRDERSQLKNKTKAMRVLRARLLDKMESDQESKIRQTRKLQVGSGDRSEKIRTYNFPDGRVTDHRIGLTLHKLEEVLNGNLNEIIEALIQADKKIKLQQWNED